MNQTKQKCICKKTNCPRHSNCEECKKHHKTNKRYPKPYCQQKPGIKKG